MERINPNEDIQSLSDSRSGVNAFIRQVSETNGPLVITQHGKGVALLADAAELEATQARLELLEEIYCP